MGLKTKILIVEHDKNDIELLRYELKRGGIKYECQVVETEVDYSQALVNFIPDIILSDYTLPAFNGAAAFAMRESMAPETPFIFVSGAIREENAVEMTKRGMTEYALKDKLYSLVPKIKWALNEVKESREKHKTAAELLQSERQLARAQQIAHMGSWESDLDTNIYTWSDENCRIFGVPVEENYQSFRTFLSFVHPGDVAFVSKTIKDSFNLFSDLSYNYRIIRKSGVLRYLHTESRFAFDASGQPTGLFGITQDVTAITEMEQERKKSEQAIAESEVRLKNAEKIAHLGNWELDFSSNVLSLSDEGARILGFPPEQNQLTYEAWTSVVHPDDLEPILALIKESQSTLTETQYHHRIVLKDGTIRNIFSESKYKMGPDGKPTGMFGITQDITERKKAETLILEKNKQYTELMQNLPEAVYSCDKDGRMLLFNKASEELWGRKPMVGVDMWCGSWKIFASDGTAIPLDECPMAVALKTGADMTNIEAVIQRPDGTCRNVIVHPTLTFDLTGKLTGATNMILDITERKIKENEIHSLNETLEIKVLERTEELSKANTALEAFSYSVSHDLRAPVRTVMSFSKIIQKDYGAAMQPREKELFSFIDDGSKRMNSIIDDLLKFAKCGTEKLNYAPVNMTQLVKAIWLNLGISNPHHAVIELDELPWLKVDRSMIEQVLINLLSNAIKYSAKKEKPVIKIWSDRTDGQITVYIKDNGAGFDMKNYERLFGAFQRLHNTTEFEGNGVGLMLVKSIIEKHGGTVSATAKVNEGATFQFTIPA
jgi:PAS domain S-box-containing protein